MNINIGAKMIEDASDSIVTKMTEGYDDVAEYPHLNKVTAEFLLRILESVVKDAGWYAYDVHSPYRSMWLIAKDSVNARDN